IAECKAIGQDSQAIGGWNSPGKLRIENNYLEGSTENMLIGGGDPPTPDLVTTGVTVRYNHMAKPLAWMKPIMPTPTGVAAQAVPGGGSLPAGTYAYRVAARRKSNQNAMATSASSVEASATIAAGTTGGVTISWTPISGAEVYLVYGRTPGGQTMYWKTTDPFITDTGAEGTAVNTGTERPTYAGTKWDVKNIFELKNAQDVTVEFNVFENLWVAGQSGYPIVFTPRNQYKSAPWTIVQRVTFQHNIVRHTAGGVNILGLDNNGISRLTNNIVVKDNLFEDLSSAPFGAAKPFMVGDGPEAVTIDHNTVITNQATIVSFYGAPAMGFAYTNNMSTHGTYGMNGSGSTPGLPTLTMFAPDATVTANVFAGGPASKYPAGNSFPSQPDWTACFVDYAGGDYHLRPGCVVASPSTDGRVRGADIDVLDAMRQRALGGGTAKVPVTIETTGLPSGMVKQPYEAFLTCKGGGTVPCAWSLLASSQMPPGLAFDAATGRLFGTPTSFGSGKVAVRAFDPKDTGNLDEQTFDLVIDAPALDVKYPNPSQGEVGVPFKLTPVANNAIGPLTFAPATALPDGLALNAVSGAIEGMPTKAGVWTLGVQAGDSRGAAPVQALTITIAPPRLTISAMTLPNGRVGAMFSEMLNASGGTPPYTWTLNSGALPAGMLINASGTISGVPSTSGRFVFGVKVTDASGMTATATASLTIDSATPAASDIVLYAK